MRHKMEYFLATITGKRMAHEFYKTAQHKYFDDSIIERN